MKKGQVAEWVYLKFLYDIVILNDSATKTGCDTISNEGQYKGIKKYGDHGTLAHFILVNKIKNKILKCRLDFVRIIFLLESNLLPDTTRQQIYGGDVVVNPELNRQPLSSCNSGFPVLLGVLPNLNWI